MFEEKLASAFKIRKENFMDDVYFYAPTIKRYETDEFKNSSDPYFVPISITGADCSLKCDHCKAKILKAMHEAKDPERLFAMASEFKDKGAKGLLVSGGSDHRGIVPLLPFAESLKRIRDELGLKVIVHTGLVDEELAKALGEAKVEAAMLDMIGSDRTIKGVYHLKAAATDFERSLSLLCEQGVRVAPHVVIGLDRGRIDGEYGALEMIARYPVDSMVLVGLSPKPDTPMDGVTPPSPLEMGEIFAHARSIFPKVPVLLGCERASGEEKVEVEALALRSGLNGIAYPSEGIVAYSRELGLEPKFSELCCALLYEELN
ncbi:MAG: radical SAM protein [Actinomycetota bacterium]|nr:radical SAM protein [Actinomycetota bacterium]